MATVMHQGNPIMLARQTVATYDPSRLGQSFALSGDYDETNRSWQQSDRITCEESLRNRFHSSSKADGDPSFYVR